MVYATAADVVARLGRPLTDDEAAVVATKVVEAAALVEGYCGRVFVAPVPVAVVLAVSSIAARSLSPNAAYDAPQVSSEQYTAGAFTLNRSYSTDASAMWVGAKEKMWLRPFTSDSVSVPLVSDRGV